MFRRRKNGQITIAEFHLPFVGTLDPENCWVKLEELMPWEELEETYAPQFNATIGAPPAKSVRETLENPGLPRDNGALGAG